MISALFHQVSSPARLGALDLVEVLDWAEAALNRVDRDLFFKSFEEDYAVQYFYEPFLQAFDPELRKQLGVWYTPPEIVEYMVERVDAVLRSELGIADGLADDQVYVLDPCAGTGSYLVQVLKRIETTLRAKGNDALIAHDLKQAAVNRVFGFEILPAPFVVSHLQMGLVLQRLGAPLDEAKDERAAVYLTNALTGWEPPSGPQAKLAFPELEEERDAAEEIKRNTPILVILGNPPYNGFAGVAVDEERALSEAYRVAKRTRKPQGQGLNDLYVRFFRMAERRIVEGTGRGVVCFISNYSWLDGLSFTAMRERYLEAFDCIWIDNLNGDKYKTGKLTPDGQPDPSVFSTDWNREGIQVGTAVTLMVRTKREEAEQEEARVAFREFWGRDKRKDVLASLSATADQYAALTPPNALGLPLLPQSGEATYFQWPRLPDLFPVSFPGIKTSRDEFLVSIEADSLIERLRRYFDPRLSHDEIRKDYPGVMSDAARFRALEVRETLMKRGFLPGNIVRYSYRPLDLRWLYWEPQTKLVDEKREEYIKHIEPGNYWMVAVRQNRRAYDPPFITEERASLHTIERGANLFPLLLRDEPKNDLFSMGSPTGPAMRPNVSKEAQSFLSALQSPPEALFFHAFSVFHAPLYASENPEALRQDWPRVPLPASAEAMGASADLGRQIAALLDTASPVAGVTEGAVRAELAGLGVITHTAGGALNPAAGDLAVTAGWGHRGAGGVTMPARGEPRSRAYTELELVALEQGATVLGLSLEDVLALLGKDTYDIYLNDVAYWRNVPERVWRYTMGGYQVIKKWLSYRERPLLGRDLKPEEAREVTAMVRRIAAILLLGPALDANYEAVKADTYSWPGAAV